MRAAKFLPTMHARMVWPPDLAVMSARFPFSDRTLWIAAREADAARNDTFFPFERKRKRRGGNKKDTRRAEDHVGRRW